MPLIADSMATANLNKSEDLVTNTTAASKYVPKRPGICINQTSGNSQAID